MLLTHSCGAVDRFRVWLRKGSTLHEAFKPLKTAWIVQICTVYMDSNYRTIPELEGERIQTLPNRFEDLVELRWALLVLKVDQAICDFTKASTRQRGERAVQINSTPGRSARMHGTKTHKTPMSDCNKKNICFLIFDEQISGVTKREIVTYYVARWWNFIFFVIFTAHVGFFTTLSATNKHHRTKTWRNIHTSTHHWSF